MQAFFAPEVVEGDFLGEYQVLSVLGRGPTGTTYHVVHNALHKDFVLKVVQLSEWLDLEWTKRLDAQCAVLQKLRGKHIDAVLGSGRSGEFWFSIKDYIHDSEGRTCSLSTFQNRHGGTLSPFQVQHIVRQLLEALDEAANYSDAQHSSLHHGAIKPSNVLFTTAIEQGAPFEVKLSDFQPYGLNSEQVLRQIYTAWKAKMSGRSGKVWEKAETHALFSLYAMVDRKGPEIGPGTTPTMTGDLFSLGVLVYEMFTGRIPEGKITPLRQLRPDLPKEWELFVFTCLQRESSLRFASHKKALEFLDENFEFEPATEPEPEYQPERTSLTPPGMVFVPKATFTVGSKECGQDALPQHQVSTDGFYMDRTPVTVGQFAKFAENTGFVSEAEAGDGAPIWLDGEWQVIPGVSWRNPTGGKLPRNFSNHPVTQLTFADVHAYCEWIGRRLPTEQEWEYAARGGLHGVNYPWGNVLSRTQANFGSDGTCEVMLFPANGFGLYDMVGNVWEWTDSWYQPYPGNHQQSPHWGEKYRVVRGGAWMYDAADCMISYRNANQPERAYPTVGFRTVCDFNR